MGMRLLRFFGILCCFVAAGALLAGADSLQLRNGRHLQGKYIGGSSTAVGFMSGGSVEYFTTSDVLALIFDNTNDSPLSGIQPNPMKGWSPAALSGTVPVREISSSTQDCSVPSVQRLAVGSNSFCKPDLNLDEPETDLRLLESPWPDAELSSAQAWQQITMALW